MHKVEVKWETDENEVDLPHIVKLPKEVNITSNEEVCSYLSNEFGWLVNEWNVWNE